MLYGHYKAISFSNAPINVTAQPLVYLAGSTQPKNPAPLHAPWPLWGHGLQSQSACLRKNAGISKLSMPPEDSASTLAAAWVRPVRQTLGTLGLP